jgi:hypothetical protein
MSTLISKDHMKKSNGEADFSESAADHPQLLYSAKQKSVLK